MAVETVGLLNSNNTLINNDTDFTKFENYLTNGTGGVMFSDFDTKAEFALTGTINPSIAQGSAIVVCTRSTSTPVANEKLALRFTLGSSKSFTGAVNGSKIYIEVDKSLIDDPMLIADVFPSTDYALGLNIGSVVMNTSYPATNFYLPLWEYDGTDRTDVRVAPMINGRTIDLSDLSDNIETSGTITGGRIKTSFEALENDDVPNKEYVDEAVVGGVSYTSLNTIIKQGAYFGPGSDGDVTISTNTTLSRDMYYNNLTIGATYTLYTAGYKVYVKGELINNGTINQDGNNASGITGGAALNQGTLGANLGGSNGGAGGSSSANGNPGTAGVASNPSYSNVNSVGGGNGGNRSSFAGGSGGGGATTTRGANYNKVLTFEEFFTVYMNPASQSTSSTIFDTKYFSSSKYKGPASAGGGGGGGAGLSSTGGNGGGGGGNGGVIWIAAATLTNNGVITAKGGNGANGGNGGGTTGAGGGGGGGGGNGGVVYLIYNEATIGTITTTGGTAGTGGTQIGGGSNGTAGTAGNAGTTIQIQIT